MNRVQSASQDPDRDHDRLFEEVKKLIGQGYEDIVIESLLHDRGAGKETVDRIMREVKKLRSAKRNRTGLLFILLGVLLLGVGFISSVAVHQTGGDIVLPLYGLTTVGLVLLFIGLVMIF